MKPPSAEAIEILRTMVRGEAQRVLRREKTHRAKVEGATPERPLAMTTGLVAAFEGIVEATVNEALEVAGFGDLGPIRVALEHVARTTFNIHLSGPLFDATPLQREAAADGLEIRVGAYANFVYPGPTAIVPWPDDVPVPDFGEGGDDGSDTDV